MIDCVSMSFHTSGHDGPIGLWVQFWSDGKLEKFIFDPPQGHRLLEQVVELYFQEKNKGKSQQGFKF
jgi:hypothetical protein